MTTIDNRVVQMTFDNAQFERGIQTSMSSLKNLDKSLELKGASSGLSKLTGVASSTFSKIGNFALTFGKIGVGAVASIGAALGGLALKGGIRRALNLDEANFKLRNLLHSTEKANKVMDNVKAAVSGTKFGLDEAALVASQLVASGVQAGDQLSGVLRAIAGTATMTGQSFQQVGNIFAKVKSNGKLMTRELRQFSAAGVNVAAILAKHMHKSEQEINEMVTKGEIKFEQFSEILGKEFGDASKKANETFSGALANVKAALSRIGASFAVPAIDALKKVFANLIPVIDGVHAAMQPLIDLFEKKTGEALKFATEAMKKFQEALLPKDTKNKNDLGQLGETIKSFVEPLNSVIGVLTKAFSVFVGFMGNLGRIAAMIFKIVSPLFPVLVKIADVIVSALGKVNDMLTGVLTSDVVVSAVDSISQALTNLISGVEGKLPVILGFFDSFKNFASGGISKFLGLFSMFKKDDSSGSAFQTVSAGLQKVSNAALSTSGMLGIFKEKLSDAIGKVKDFGSNSLSSGKDFISGLGPKIFDAVKNGLVRVKELIGPIGDIIMEVKDKVLEFAHSFTFGDLIDTGKLIVLSKIAKTFASFKDDITGALGLKRGIGEVTSTISSFGRVLDSLSGYLNAMTQQVKATSLVSIATAIGILAVSLLILSGIDPKALALGASAIGVLAAELVGAFKLLSMTSIQNPKALARLTPVMIALSASLLILSFAVEKFGNLDWNQLAKGAAALGYFTAVVAGLGAVMSKFKLTKSIGRLAPVMIALSGSLLILSLAAERFGNMDWEQLAKGGAALAVFAGGISVMALAVGKAKPARLIEASIAMLALSGSMMILAKVIENLGSMDPQALMQGIAGMAGAMITLAGAVAVLSQFKGAIGGAAAIMIVAAALNILAPVIAQFAAMKPEEVATSLITLAGALGIIAGALYLMKASIEGAAALGIAAKAVLSLAIALIAFSMLEPGALAQALIGLAAALAIMGVAGYAISGALPALLGLSVVLVAISAAIAILGAGIALAGLGMLAFTAAMSQVANMSIESTKKVSTNLRIIIENVAKALVELAKCLGEALVAFAQTIAEHATELSEAAIEITEAFLNGLLKIIPKIANFALQLITSLLDVIAKNMPKLTRKGADVIIAFIQGMTANIPRITQAGINAIITLINAMANSIRTNYPRFRAALINLANAVIDMGKQMALDALNIGRHIIQGLINGVTGLAGAFKDKLMSIGKNALTSVAHTLGIKSPSRKFMQLGVYMMEGLIIGLDKSAYKVYDTTTAIAQNVLDTFDAVLSDDSSMEFHPVITPVIDDSMVSRGMASVNSKIQNGGINTMFDANVHGTVSEQLRTIQEFTKAISDLSDKMSRPNDVSVSLNYNAGTTPNEMVLGIAESIRMTNLMSGVA